MWAFPHHGLLNRRLECCGFCVFGPRFESRCHVREGAREDHRARWAQHAAARPMTRRLHGRSGQVRAPRGISYRTRMQTESAVTFRPHAPTGPE